MRVLAILTLAAALTACGNFPTAMGKVPPRVNIAAAFGDSRNYDAIDKYSFVQAELEYPADNGHHRIAIGDYLLAEVFDILKDREVRSLRLVEFRARCNYSGSFMPHALCEVTYKIDIRETENRLVEGKLGPIDIGGVRARQSGLLITVTLGDDSFQKQVSPVLQAIGADLRAKL